MRWKESCVQCFARFFPSPVHSPVYLFVQALAGVEVEGKASSQWLDVKHRSGSCAGLFWCLLFWGDEDRDRDWLWGKSAAKVWLSIVSSWAEHERLLSPEAETSKSSLHTGKGFCFGFFFPPFIFFCMLPDFISCWGITEAWLLGLLWAPSWEISGSFHELFPGKYFGCYTLICLNGPNCAAFN